MKIYLCRHGNTFDKGDKVVWVGKHEDLALTDKGRQQAKDMAGQIEKDEITPVLYFAAPLKRTREYAEIMRQKLDWDVPLTIDPRLSEVDYGYWGGKTTEEINEKYGEAALERWNSESKVPENCGWGETEAEIRARLDDFLKELQTQIDLYNKTLSKTPAANPAAIITTSNGIIRLLLEKLDPEQFNQKKSVGTLKVPTGGWVLVG